MKQQQTWKQFTNLVLLNLILVSITAGVRTDITVLCFEWYCTWTVCLLLMQLQLLGVTKCLVQDKRQEARIDVSDTFYKWIKSYCPLTLIPLIKPGRDSVHLLSEHFADRAIVYPLPSAHAANESLLSFTETNALQDTINSYLNDGMAMIYLLSPTKIPVTCK